MWTYKRSVAMFNFFKKKSPIEALELRYRQLLEKSYRLSTTDRKASDQKRAEAEELALEIDKLRNQS
ncbi:MAG: Lacal_2735 family protein [Bacteroidota bacterium]